MEKQAMAPPSRDMWANSPHVQASQWHPCPPDEGDGNSQCGCHLLESPMCFCIPGLGTQLSSFVGGSWDNIWSGIKCHMDVTEKLPRRLHY